MRPGLIPSTAAAFAFFAVNNAALAVDDVYPYHMMWGGGGFVGSFMMLFFIAIAVVVVFMVVRWLRPADPSGGSGTNAKSAIAILEERYARGEIDKQEFEEKRRVMGS